MKLGNSYSWARYKELLCEHHIKRTIQQQYVDHVKNYIQSRKDIELSFHRAYHLSSYLTSLFEQTTISQQEFCHIVLALRIVVLEQFQLPWAKNFDWDYWLTVSKTDTKANHRNRQ